jgi:hypothetical protein
MVGSRSLMSRQKASVLIEVVFKALADMCAGKGN